MTDEKKVDPVELLNRIAGELERAGASIKNESREKPQIVAEVAALRKIADLVGRHKVGEIHEVRESLARLGKNLGPIRWTQGLKFSKIDAADLQRCIEWGTG